MRRSTNSGLFALSAVSLYYLYKNRGKVQDFVQNQNINIPWLNKGLGMLGGGEERIGRGVGGKVSGKGKEGISDISSGVAHKTGSDKAAHIESGKSSKTG